MGKWVYSFGAGRNEGKAEMRNLLGGKGANLAEMASIGLPVPPGFTITTEVCTWFYEHGKKYPEDLRAQVDEALARVEEAVGNRFGDAKRPLLVSVRSGARVSMPGMMDTVLNLGLNDQTVEGLEAASGDARFAWDSYRRFIQMYGSVVLGIDHHRFEEIIEDAKLSAGATEDTALTARDWRGVVDGYKAMVQEVRGEPFPQDPQDQLWGAIGAVFGSWMNPRANTYRRLHDIPDSWGTAVTVQAMVFVACDLYRVAWRYIGYPDLLKVLKAATLSSLLVAALLTLVGSELSRGVLILDWIIVTVLLSGLRLLLRAGSGMRRRAMRRPQPVRRVLILGVNDLAESLTRDFERRTDAAFRVIGFLDDQGNFQGQTIQGRPVLGVVNDVAKVVVAHGIEELVIALPEATGPEIRRIIRLCERLPVRLRILQDPWNGHRQLALAQVRDVCLDDLLRRPPRPPPCPQAGRADARLDRPGQRRDPVALVGRHVPPDPVRQPDARAQGRERPAAGAPRSVDGEAPARGPPEGRRARGPLGRLRSGRRRQPE